MSVIGFGDWPDSPQLTSERLSLEPLSVEHATEMAPLLDDPRLHTFTGGSPDTPGELRGRYEQLVRGRSADGSQRWFNWVVRLRQTAQVVGTTQATVIGAEGGDVAEVAWVIGVEHQGRGYAREGAVAMATWLRQEGAQSLVAYIHPQHEASMGVARALGLSPTDEVVDGEVRWVG
jgi:RimJ/RimL family protein N-acetyltransferase